MVNIKMVSTYEECTSNNTIDGRKVDPLTLQPLHDNVVLIGNYGYNIESLRRYILSNPRLSMWLDDLNSDEMAITSTEEGLQDPMRQQLTLDNNKRLFEIISFPPSVRSRAQPERFSHSNDHRVRSSRRKPKSYKGSRKHGKQKGGKTKKQKRIPSYRKT